MYGFEGRVRFSEVDHTERMTLPALIDYFQDCSIFQSEDIGLGIDKLKEEKKAWILSSWQIIVKRYPKLGEKIRIWTWATGFEGFFGTRNFKMEKDTGEVLAYANSIWIFMDVKKGRPVRPQEDDVAAYGLGLALDMEYAPRKISLPKEAEVQEDFPVQRHQIDTNEHVNNGQYVQMAIEVLPECERAGKIRVEYRKSAVFGDRIYPRVAREETRKVVELGDETGKPYAVVEFR